MIEVRDLTKFFGAQKILDGVSLRIETGESVVIIGRSGGGKSVLLKHLIGLLTPDSGTVLVDGENIEGMNERQLLHQNLLHAIVQALPVREIPRHNLLPHQAVNG